MHFSHIACLTFHLFYENNYINIFLHNNYSKGVSLFHSETPSYMMYLLISDLLSEWNSSPKGHRVKSMQEQSSREMRHSGMKKNEDYWGNNNIIKHFL